jgi:CRP-like cAMP-binding protein
MRPMDTKSADIPLLAGLKPKDREQVLRSARRRTFEPGEIVVSEGSPALHLYVVVTGHADVEMERQGHVGRLAPGDFFGELALIEEHARTATVTASDELTCLMLPAWEFRALLEEHPEIALPMLRALIARTHRKEHHEG